MAIVHTRGFRPHVYRESAWFWPIAEPLARFDAHARFPRAEELSALYEERNAALGLPPLRFVEALKSKAKRGSGRPIVLGELYEGRIIERGEVPTRPDDWHDLFNALAFITFPRAKRALHLRQYELFRARITPTTVRLPNARTREQDALSLLDEGGLCIAAPPAVAASLNSGERSLDDALSQGAAHAIPFGHALFEHLVADLPCPLATPYLLTVGTADEGALLGELDVALARALSDPSAFRAPSGVRGLSLPELPAPRSHAGALSAARE